MHRTKPLLFALAKTGGLVATALTALFGVLVLLSARPRRIVADTPLKQFFAPIVDSAVQTVGFTAAVVVLLAVGLSVLWKVR